jgi:Protein of unknown function (DUF4038)/Putative collagen-binding domain of a collagenase
VPFIWKFLDMRLLNYTCACIGAVALLVACGSVTVPRPATAAPVDTATPSGRLAYPLKQSANNRYLVDQNNAPALLVGDSPHSLFVNLTPTLAKGYFQNRAAQGINVVWIELLCVVYTGGRPSGATFDGIVPFTTQGDFATPNPAYFARVDQMIQLAAQSNITVLLDTIDTGGLAGPLVANGVTKSYNYGAYLGKRYKSFPNIIWITGNDFQNWGNNPAANADAAAIMRGIADTDKVHLQTTELDYLSSASLDDRMLAPYTSLAGVYTYHPTYAEVLREYNAANNTPIFMEEANYEFEDNNGFDSGNTPTLRRQEYWSMLSGAAGQLYGNHFTWTFAAGWTRNLTTPGVRQLKYMKSFFSQYAWWSLVPDQGHKVVTAGYGNFATGGSIAGNNYVTAAKVPDGSLALAYCPTATTLTVNMTNMRGATTAKWFDPSNSAYRAIPGSPFSHTGTQRFTTPGANGDGHFDWVLVLQSP